MPPQRDQLTPKQRKFIEGYLTCWNSSKAAREAGYKHASHVASGLLKTPIIREAIEKRLKESAMSSNEVMARLAEQARLNASMFFKFEWVPVVDGKGKPVLDENGDQVKEYLNIGIDWKVFEEYGYLVKRLGYTSRGKPFLEFHDSQAALLSMSKFMSEQPKEEGEQTEFILPATVIAPSFVNAYRDIKNHLHTEYVFFGGRGSTKSSFISESIIDLILNNPSVHALATRQVANTLRDSVFSQLTWAINELGLSSKFKSTTNPLEIQYIPTGQKIYFRGADDPLKIKSIKPPFGYIGILWCEELDQFHGAESVRSIEQSAIRGGDVAWIFKSFNPPQTKSNWANKYIEIPKETQYRHKSNYLDVPPEWLGKTFLEEADHLKNINPKAYEHEYLGVPNSAGGMVFENTELRKITDDEIYGELDPKTGKRIGGFDRVFHGLDWGFYPDPAHYARCHYDAARLTLYVFGEVRRWKTSNRELYDALIEYGYKPSETIIPDSAEPKSIGDFRDYGATARPAEKGPESVKYSMKWLQSLRKIVIDPERAPYAAEEFTNYEYEVTKDGEILSDYPDKNNHAIDAVRYATNHIWKRRGQ